MLRDAGIEVAHHLARIVPYGFEHCWVPNVPSEISFVIVDCHFLLNEIFLCLKNFFLEEIFSLRFSLTNVYKFPNLVKAAILPMYACIPIHALVFEF